VLGDGRRFLRIVSVARFDINGDENFGSVNRYISCVGKYHIVLDKCVKFSFI